MEKFRHIVQSIPRNPDELRGVSRDIKRKAISQFQEYVLIGNPINRPDDYAEITQNFMQDGHEYWPVVFGTHKAHPAGFMLMEEALNIQEIINPFLPEHQQIDGSLLFIAHSMHNGQSEDIVKGLKNAEPLLQRYNADTLPILRKQDAGKLDEDERRHYRRTLLTKTGSIVANGQIPLILPEATVESGRQKPGGVPGEIKGMRYLDDDTVSFISAMIRKQKKEPLFFFMGVTGENTIYNPITSQVTNEANIKAVLRSNPELRKKFGPLMQGVIDYPTPLYQIEEAFQSDGKFLSGGIPEWYVGERLASLVPSHERGELDTQEIILHPNTDAVLRRDTRDLF